ncbi:hypothetical protein FXB40_24885 [Bradyrhizobium rifense]|uniref:Tc1-like transposase DDE domain-containing protein n=1 Tax=Bradyrhizobium rifense TaxID=515499 RepID=A0A5D3KG30_9BRAD|nr:hypothetical protein FXB40_24885 [Bradyrhizobium rifense]
MANSSPSMSRRCWRQLWQVAILDNLGSHKGKAARNTIRAPGAHLLFLPPYSPDLNPIEQQVTSSSPHGKQRSDYSFASSSITCLVA